MRTDDIADVKRTLWAAADQIRANSQLTPAEFRGPALGLIFLAYAEHRFEQVRPGLEAKATVRPMARPLYATLRLPAMPLAAWTMHMTV